MLSSEEGRSPSREKDGHVLDTVRINTVIGLGDGAGSNILARFEVMHHARYMGVLLVSPTATAATAARFPCLSISSPQGYVTLHRSGYSLEDIESEAGRGADRRLRRLQGPLTKWASPRSTRARSASRSTPSWHMTTSRPN